MLTDLPSRFINYRRQWDSAKQKWQKIPCDSQGHSIDPHTPDKWRAYDDAAEYALWDESQPDKPYGVGFVLNGDGWFFYDLDACLDTTTKQWEAWADLTCRTFNGAYGEVSTSGNGLHIIGRCDPAVLADRQRKWGKDEGKEQEFYTDKRFVALSRGGLQPIGGTATDKDWTRELLSLVPQREFLGELPDGRDPAYTGPEDDDALIAAMLRSYSAAAAFGDAATVKQLWEGDVNALAKHYAAYEDSQDFDHSSADAALMSHLAFWTGKDMPRMDRLFRRSALMRDKFEKRADYRRDTIQNAARLCKRVYDKPRPASAEPIRTSTFFSASDLEGRTVSKREWLVPNLIPSGTVTLLSGDGGTGKSLVALQLAFAVSSGGEWLGIEVKHSGAIMISAEDDANELHRRLEDIKKAAGKTYADCNRLTLRSLAGEDALLAFEGSTCLEASSLFKELEDRAKADKPVLIVIDTLADVFPANENDRAKVRQFVGILRGLALRNNCAVVLLSHPSLTGLSQRTGTSGSTAWNNSVRSRLYLERRLDEGYEADPNIRVLSLKKQNYGQTGAELLLRWEAGVFVAQGAASITGSVNSNMKAERVFLRLLEMFTEQNRPVNPNSGSNYAPRQFAEHPNSEGVSKRGFKLAMEQLLASGKIKIGETGPPSKRTKFVAINENYDERIVPIISTSPSPPFQMPSGL